MPGFGFRTQRAGQEDLGTCNVGASYPGSRRMCDRIALAAGGISRRPALRLSSGLGRSELRGCASHRPCAPSSRASLPSRWHLGRCSPTPAAVGWSATPNGIADVRERSHSVASTRSGRISVAGFDFGGVGFYVAKALSRRRAAGTSSCGCDTASSIVPMLVDALALRARALRCHRRATRRRASAQTRVQLDVIVPADVDCDAGAERRRQEPARRPNMRELLRNGFPRGCTSAGAVAEKGLLQRPRGIAGVGGARAVRSGGAALSRRRRNGKQLEDFGSFATLATAEEPLSRPYRVPLRPRTSGRRATTTTSRSTSRRST